MTDTNRTSTSSSPHTLQIEHCRGDMFVDAPPGTLLVHACNARGAWGSGVAIEFKTKYPAAFAAYKAHCRTNEGYMLLGKAMLMTPRVAANGNQTAHPSGHFIGCLFTRVNYGPPTIHETNYGYDKLVLESTWEAMEALLIEIESRIDGGDLHESEITEIRMPRINSGRFAVDWNKTEEYFKKVEIPPGLEDLEACRTVKVYTPGDA